MITLTTDFGGSEYVGAMKGAILSIKRDALIVDLTHAIKPFDIRHGAYAIYSTFPFFPRGAVHVVVVDPGVGTERKGIIIESGGHFFVGPDNGVFSLIEAEKVYEIREKGASTTFHGRDVFAPVAAKIDSGHLPSELGIEIEGHKKILKKQVEVSDSIKGEVYFTDRFGNIITSIRREHIIKSGLKGGDVIEIRLGDKRVTVPFARTYGDFEKEGLGALLNSFEHLEISSREGSAAEKLKVDGGEPVEVIP